MTATKVSSSSRTPPIAKTHAARTSTRVRARAGPRPAWGVRPPEINAMETPASVAKRIDDRPSTSARQVAGSQPSSPVSPRCAPNIPRTARPRATSRPPIRRPGDAAGGEQHDRQLAPPGDVGDQVVRGAQFSGCDEELGLVQGAQPTDAGAD